MKDPNKESSDYWTHERLAEIEVSWRKRPSVNKQENDIRSLVAAVRFARQERDEQSDRADDNFTSTRRISDYLSTVVTSARLMLTRLDSNGLWEDGCFYYCRHAAPELQEPIEALTKVLSVPTKKPSKRLHVFKGTSQRHGAGLCTACGNFAAHKLHVIPQEGNEI